MYEWMDHWAHGHAEDLIEDAHRHRLARALRDAKRNERPAGRRYAGRLVDLARGTFADKGVLEQPICEEHLAK